MASTGESSSTPKWRFDVFLSFTGKDTRLRFTDHLHAALKKRGFIVFRDNEGIEKGEAIKQQLLKAIEDSLYSIIILSENYAFSTWCLDELQKILEASEKLGRQVFPIFYDVDPSDVRKQRKSFEKALAKHDETFKHSNDKDKVQRWRDALTKVANNIFGWDSRGRFEEALAKHDETFKHSNDKDKVQRWRDALTQVADISGWDSRGRHEVDLIEEIVEEIWKDLCTKLPPYFDNLIGIDSRIVEMNLQYLEMGLGDVRFVGIWGMGGLGKTTLARAVFERFSNQFDACGFLSNVRDTSDKYGLAQLQQQLIERLIDGSSGQKIWDTDEGKKIIKKICSQKKVLLVLDDVNHINQLENLAESLDWFGEGSRVIITTRDKHLLTSHGVHKVYEIKLMKKDESLQLFSKKAFKKNYPEKGFLELSEDVVQYSGGLPLALKTLGSFLCGRRKPEWENSLKRLKKIPNADIHQILRISYDGLNEEEKTIFLDVACFFIGWRKDLVAQVLESCDLHATIGLSILIERSLLIEKDIDSEGICLEMHDLVQEFGMCISSEEYPHSRLCCLEDIDEALKSDIEGTKTIQAIQLSVKSKSFKFDEAHWHSGFFLKRFNLRFLVAPKRFNLRFLVAPKSKSFDILKGLFSATKVICCRKGYSLQTLPIEGPFDKLVGIHMPESLITHLWHGVQFLGKLKHIDMEESKWLIETPDFSGVQNLETLDLESCRSLIKIHPSLGELKKLVRVNLSSCINLKILPIKLENNDLRELILTSCHKVTRLPTFGENMKNLSRLLLQKTSIKELPESIGFLTSLTELDLSDCRIEDVSFLHIGCISSLVVLNLNSENFIEAPAGWYSNLLQLRYLLIESCDLHSLAELPSCLIRLDVNRIKEPLGEEQMWNLFASLDHKRRCGTKYLGTQLTKLKSEGHPCTDFVATFSYRGTIPSWFLNRANPRGKTAKITVDIPQCCRDSEWSGIAMWLELNFGEIDDYIQWTSYSPKDYKNAHKGWGHWMPDFCGWGHCLMLLHFNDETCWKHVTGDNNQLVIEIRCYGDYGAYIEECGWRLLCKEEMDEWCNKANGPNSKLLNKLSVEEVGPSELWLSDSIVNQVLNFKAY